MEYPKDGYTYYILNIHSKTAMTLYDDGVESVTKPVQGLEWYLVPHPGPNNNKSQQWNVKYTQNAHNGQQYVTLQNIRTGRFLDLDNNGGDKAVLLVGNSPSGSSQEWSFVPEGTNEGNSKPNTYRFSADLKAGSPNPNTPIQTWNDTPGNAPQIWAFVEVGQM